MDKQDKVRLILKSTRSYSMQNNAACFLDGDCLPSETCGEGLYARIQNYVKKYQSIYYGIVKLLNPKSLHFRKTEDELLASHGQDKVIVNLGSGPEVLGGRTDIINVDRFAFDCVDICADCSDLPLEDGSVDLVFCISVLEHVEEPKQVVSEIYRILRDGGVGFIEAPFMYPVHAAPCDYQRWTPAGIRYLLKEFGQVEVRCSLGVFSSVANMLQEMVAAAFSFRCKVLYDMLFMASLVIFSPLKYLDLLFEQVTDHMNSASSYYAIIKK